MKTFSEFINESTSKNAITRLSVSKGGGIMVRKGTNKTAQYMIYTGKQLKFEDSYGKTIKIIDVENTQEALDYLKKEKYEYWS